MKFKATLFALLAASTPLSQAQTTYTWDGGNYSTSPDNNWGTAINWSSDTVPVKSSNTILTFSGNAKATTNNNLGDWALDIGQLNFNSPTMGSILTGNAFGFLPLNSSQQINQNSAYGARIGNTFAFRSGSDSQINLNASGPLHVDSTVYLDASSGTARQFVIGGTTNDLNTFVVNGTIAKSGSGYDPDMVIQNNKRVAVFGALTFGSGTDGSVMIKSGRLEFHGTGSMTGAPVIGSSSGSDSAMLLLNSDGQTMANQLEILGGSTGRRVIGGQNTSGNVTFSGTLIGSNAPADYDVVAATGGSVTLSGSRNLNSVLNINRPDGSTTYGGTVVLSGTSTSTSGVAVYGGTLSVGADSQLGGSGAITLDGGTLKQSARFSTARNIMLGSNGGKIDTSVVDAFTNPALSGAISGSGNLEIAAHGSYANATDRLQLTGNNTYVGSTTITSGYVNGASATAFGNAANTVVLNGGGLNFDSSRTHNYKLSLVNRGNLNVESGFTVNAATAISGTGGLDKRGTGTLSLSAANTYSGATRVVAGTLNVQNADALSMSTLDLATADNGTVNFSFSILPRIMICDLGRTGNLMLTSF
jgi:autotransporter-associated beta strand protein